MSDQSRTFYLTTPIYYVNARPHIGHAYSTIVADVLARRHRLLGEDTYFLTGTDEHGQKIERSAAAAGIPPQQFTDQVSAQFSSLWGRMGITHDQFIRTTSNKHKRGAQKLFSTLYEKGFIYLDSYTGSYCVSDEAFVDAPSGTPCPDCGRALETVTEENFFFKLSAFQQPLIDLIESNTLVITPDSSRNEVLSFIRSGLRDLSVSRSSFTWGIPVPEPAASESKQKHVIYVWLDALANYMTALGYGSDDESLWQKYWPADIHLVGKEITRFHCIYWPAFLMAAGIETPKQITANGWLLFDNAKMSKSRGNVVRTETILDAFGTLCPPPVPPDLVILSEAKDLLSADIASHSVILSGAPELAEGAQPKDPEGASPAITSDTFSTIEPTPHDRDLFAADVLRYYLLREIPFGQDGSFSFDSLIARYNADLANGYGNLVSRTLKMVADYFPDGFTQIFPGSFSIAVVENANPDYYHGWYVGDIPSDSEKLFPIDIYLEQLYLRNDFAAALREVAALTSQIDLHLAFHKPWVIAKSLDSNKKETLQSILYPAAESIRIITALLYPILPYTTARVWAQLGLGNIEQAARNGDLKDLQWGGLKPGTKLGPLGPIFPRADKGLAQIMINAEEQLATGNSQPETGSTTPSQDSTHPAAGPRTASLDEPSGTLPVAGSHAHTTGPTNLPSHKDIPGSGIFAQPAATTPTTDNLEPTTSTIAIDDFIKVELRVAQIIVAERIPKADKLLRLEVDLGSFGKRQILSGIAEWYTPEDLIGRRIVVITNLAPRKMRGLESHGMLLAASEGDHGKPVLATFAEDIALGSRLK